MSALHPSVSVVMNVYNGEKYLRQAIESILAQTYTNFEFIIIDDGSRDGTFPILTEYAARDPRINLQRFAENRGVVTSRIESLGLARGTYIAPMDADDISLPRRLEDQVRFMDAHWQCDVLGTAFTLIDNEGKPLRKVNCSQDLLIWALLFSSPIANSSVMMRASTIKKLGGYDRNMPYSEDYELWTRVALAGRISSLNDVYVLLRDHSERITYKKRQVKDQATLEAKQNYLRAVLGKDVRAEAVEAILYKATTTRQAISVVELIGDYCEYCILNKPFLVRLKIIILAFKQIAKRAKPFLLQPKMLGMILRRGLRLLSFVVIGKGNRHTSIFRK
jgi:glycosyltransferase involved in cell wall biosynthesis